MTHIVNMTVGNLTISRSLWCTSLMRNASVIIDFVTGSRIQPPSEPLHNCLSMQVILSDGREIAVPADQVVFYEDSHGAARVGLGGMSFEGVEGKNLVFWRVHDLLPDEHLSPQRELKVTVLPAAVQSIHVQGNKVWPARGPESPTLNG